MTDPGSRTAGRAAAWADLARTYEAAGRRDRALVCARSAMALLDPVDDADDLDRARAEVERLTGPDVVPMHVDVAAGEHDAGAQARAEQRAVWLGAPVDPVLALVGWVASAAALDVVRVVVPGTRRGRSAFATLVAALPDVVDVRVQLPARDPALLRVCERAGFVVLPGSRGASGHVGGSLRVHRPAVTEVRGRQV